MVEKGYRERTREEVNTAKLKDKKAAGVDQIVNEL